MAKSQTNSELKPETHAENERKHEQGEELTAAYQRWSNNRVVITKLFSNSPSLLSLANSALAKRLIPHSILDSVNERFPRTDSERASRLLQYLRKKAKFNSSVLSALLECLDDECYKDIRDYLKNKPGTPSAVLETSTDTLVEILAGPNLNRVAIKLKAKALLTDEEYSSIVDPEEHHTADCLNKVLKMIDIQIKKNPERLNDFIKILENMGEFYDDLVHDLKGTPIHC